MEVLEGLLVYGFFGNLCRYTMIRIDGRPGRSCDDRSNVQQSPCNRHDLKPGPNPDYVSLLGPKQRQSKGHCTSKNRRTVQDHRSQRYPTHTPSTPKERPKTAAGALSIPLYDKSRVGWNQLGGRAVSWNPVTTSRCVVQRQTGHLDLCGDLGTQAPHGGLKPEASPTYAATSTQRISR